MNGHKVYTIFCLFFDGFEHYIFIHVDGSTLFTDGFKGSLVYRHTTHRNVRYFQNSPSNLIQVSTNRKFHQCISVIGYGNFGFFFFHIKITYVCGCPDSGVNFCPESGSNTNGFYFPSNVTGNGNGTLGYRFSDEFNVDIFRFCDGFHFIGYYPFSRIVHLCHRITV